MRIISIYTLEQGNPEIWYGQSVVGAGELSKTRRSIMNETDVHHEPLVKLHAGLFFLMNEYAGDPCFCVAEKIAQKMEQIQKHPLLEVLPELQTQYAKCINNWRARACFGHKATRSSIAIH